MCRRTARMQLKRSRRSKPSNRWFGPARPSMFRFLNANPYPLRSRTHFARKRYAAFITYSYCITSGGPKGPPFSFALHCRHPRGFLTIWSRHYRVDPPEDDEGCNKRHCEKLFHRPSPLKLVECHTDPTLIPPHASALKAHPLDRQMQRKFVGNSGQARNVQRCASIRQIPHHAAEGAARKFNHAGLEYPGALRGSLFHGGEYALGS